MRRAPAAALWTRLDDGVASKLGNLDAQALPNMLRATRRRVGLPTLLQARFDNKVVRELRELRELSAWHVADLRSAYSGLGRNLRDTPVARLAAREP